jgi:hypothetical protein
MQSLKKKLKKIPLKVHNKVKNVEHVQQYSMQKQCKGSYSTQAVINTSRLHLFIKMASTCFLKKVRFYTHKASTS